MAKTAIDEVYDRKKYEVFKGIKYHVDEPRKAQSRRRARDSRTTVRSRVIVAPLGRRKIAAPGYVFSCVPGATQQFMVATFSAYALMISLNEVYAKCHQGIHKHGTDDAPSSSVALGICA